MFIPEKVYTNSIQSLTNVKALLTEIDKKKKPSKMY